MLGDNLRAVFARIEAVCKRIKRNPAEITLVCVTKGIEIEKIKEVIELGINDIGENRVQEAVEKFEKLRMANGKGRKINWHMVGHLQRNKAKYAVRIFDLIHSIDSRELAEEINRQAERINKVQDILIQVNTSGEKTKFGISPEDLFSLAEELLKLKHLNLKGLMTIAPLVENAEETRLYFRKLYELKEKLYTSGITRFPLPILSMGMSQDFEVAIEEGANMIRLGRAIFAGPELFANK
ncbi:MAG: YggS family pyridoxal phosphate-dependent enzyme [Candidatus Omnitrophota bacterium]